MNDTSRPWFTDDEIADLCEGVSTPGVQIRFLRRLGLRVAVKPNGRPILLRSELERVYGAVKPPGLPEAPPHAEPDREALLAWFANRKQKNRKKAP